MYHLLPVESRMPRLRDCCRLSLVRFGVQTLLLSWIVAGLLVRPSLAVVQAINNVLPADDPFTLDDEGLPINGNFLIIDPFDPTLNATAAEQPNFEFEDDIIVGETGVGELVITGQTALRAQTMTIGDRGQLTENGPFKRGTGTVRIAGSGALYNNNYELLPPGLNYDMFGSTRAMEAGAALGYDLLVGEYGNGTLDISAGGAAEIQDAVIVGDQSGSTGTVTVDGINSFLGSGGFAIVTGGTEEDQHQMIIGRFGNGTMNITNGGTVYSVAPFQMTNQNGVAAIIGSNQPFQTNEPPGVAGEGIVNVVGSSSDWILGGTLQIGGFNDSNDATGSMEDMAGDDALYFSAQGAGTLNIRDGGLVSVVTPVPDPDGAQPTRLDVVIGESGALKLAGGTLTIQPPTQDSGGGEMSVEIDRYRLINDGDVEGSGLISVGQFRNRVLGKVIVNAGDNLTIRSKAQFNPTDPNAEEPLQNYGLIRTVGSEVARAHLKFERTSTSTTSPNRPVRPLINYRLEMAPLNGGRQVGQIHAQYATLEFESGLENHGEVLFTAGNNIVSGPVVNSAPDDLFPGDPGGVIFVSGDNTTVVFEDDVFNFGHFDLNPNISLITINQNFMMGGTSSFSTSIGGRPTGQEINHLSVGGDLTLDGAFELSVFTAPGVPAFSPQPGDLFEVMSAAGELTPGSNFTSFASPCTVALCYVGFPDYNLDAYFVLAFSAAAAMGADFDGSGFVDNIDLAILRQNLGGPGPIGDANGDGIVDGIDLFIWSTTIGPVPGAGGGSGPAALAGSVPEPGGFALLALGGWLTLACRRRR
jgi:T5SS/PEP-CTERM-associated repeat protein